MGMIQLRNKTPSRRKNPSAVTRHGDHKPSLKEDFKSRCGYCDAHDRWQETYYEVDHFIPMSFCKISGNISPTDYYNLVYSCRKCNNAKRAKWPSKSERDFHKNGEGFLDPCDMEYAKQFYRCDRGRIYAKTDSDLGKWMHSTFKFGIRERSIELIWQLDRLHQTMQKLKKNQKTFVHGSEKWQKIQRVLLNSALMYYDIDTQLRDFRSK